MDVTKHGLAPCFCCLKDWRSAKRGDPLQQMFGMNWLGKQFEFITFFACSVEKIRGTGLSGKKQYARARTMLLDGNNGFNTIDSRHNNVGDDQIGTPSPAKIDGRVATVKRQSIIAFTIQYLRQAVSNHNFIIDNHNTFQLSFDMRQFCL